MRQATRQECLLDEGNLILSTIHLAGGLNAIDGCIPSDLGTGNTPEFEEERRLLYVAMTCAKDHLHLILPQRFFAHQQKSNGDRHIYTARTRFISDSIVDRFGVARSHSSCDGEVSKRPACRHRYANAPHVEMKAPHLAVQEKVIAFHSIFPF
jgi:superfamily I DNA/RNA helicase